MGRMVLSILIAHRTVQALGMQVHMEALGTHHSKRPKLDQNIHSFKNFYSASLSPLLLRGTSVYCTDIVYCRLGLFW